MTNLYEDQIVANRSFRQSLDEQFSQERKEFEAGMTDDFLKQKARNEKGLIPDFLGGKAFRMGDGDIDD